LAVSMAMAAILEKSTLKGTTSHGIWYSYSKMAAIAMETAKMLKKWKTQKWSYQVTCQIEIDETS
jgi:hypothetical protein